MGGTLHHLYLKLFVNVIVGVGAAFEIPVLVVVLMLLRITTPGFLLRQSRYAVLGIVMLAAILTPTQDVPNLALFAVPMCALYFGGILAGWLLIRKPGSGKILLCFLIAAGIALGALAAGILAAKRYCPHLVYNWPFIF